MGPPSYMRSVVDRNVVMRRIIVRTRTGSRYTYCVHGLATGLPDDRGREQRNSMHLRMHALGLVVIMCTSGGVAVQLSNTPSDQR